MLHQAGWKGSRGCGRVTNKETIVFESEQGCRVSGCLEDLKSPRLRWAGLAVVCARPRPLGARHCQIPSNVDRLNAFRNRMCVQHVQDGRCRESFATAASWRRTVAQHDDCTVSGALWDSARTPRTPVFVETWYQQAFSGSFGCSSYAKSDLNVQYVQYVQYRQYCTVQDASLPLSPPSTPPDTSPYTTLPGHL